MNPEAPERFVDADEAARFVTLTRRRILELARTGKLPGHPIGHGVRRVWRFRLSELTAAFVAEQPVLFTSHVTRNNKIVKTVPGPTE
jgi:hypothetical protein